MQNNLDEWIDEWMAGIRDEMIEAIKSLVRIRSVGDGFHPETSHPFGNACSQVLDEAEKLIRRLGLRVKPYDYYGTSALYPGATEKSIGFFSHLDVVPEGEGWSFPPYDPFTRDGFLFGRGGMDNKGPAVAALYVLKFLKDNNIALKHNVFVFLGCDEEKQMRDVQHFTQVEGQPSFCLVSDSGFPLCHGEKGILTADFVTDLHGGNLLDFHGGHASNTVPVSAYAILSGVSVDTARNALDSDIQVEEHPAGVKITAGGIGGHAAFPDGTLSAVWKLAEALRKSGLVTEPAGRAVRFLAQCFSDHDGKGLGIDYADAVSGKTTHVAGTVRTMNGRLTVNVNVRYSVTADSQRLQDNLKRKGLEFGYSVENITVSPAFYFSPDHPAVSELAALANEVLQTNLPPYVMGGATHARWLPNAVGYGPNRFDRANPFPPGRGGAHQPDEALLLEDLWNGLKIYIRAVLMLDHLVD